VYFVASISDRVVGCCAVLTGAAVRRFRPPESPEPLPPGADGKEIEGRITRVGVMPECHGRGVGRRLVQRCIEWAREERGLKVLRLMTSSAQEPAIALYRSAGFKPIQRFEMFPLFNFHELLMELPL
jgi:ribosomal protein S18 acetylase RimI-like enzyme